MAQQVLIIEDDADIAALLKLNLSELGLSTVWEADGRRGFEHAQRASFDLIVLDLMLPSMNGLEVCKALRAQPQYYTPILMLTAKTTELDRVLGLELGADDYLGKPFSVPELQARAKALLRRAQMMRPGTAEAPALRTLTCSLPGAQLKLELDKRAVSLNGQPLALTAKEFDLLAHLAGQPGRVYTRIQLLDAVWGTTLESYEHNVNTTINRLRIKLEANPAEPRFVLTVRGAGYRFTDEAQ